MTTADVEGEFVSALVFKTNKQTLEPLFLDEVQLPQGKRNFEEAGLLFTTKFPEILCTHFIDLRKMKGWVNFGAIPCFWTFDLWMGIQHLNH